MSAVDLLCSKGFPKRGIGIPEAFCVSFLISDLRIIFHQEYVAHTIGHRNPPHRSKAKIGRRILFEGIAKSLERWVAVSLISGDEHRALGTETEQAAIYIRERYSAYARFVDKAQNAEIAFVPVVFCGAQRNCIARAFHDPMPKHEPVRRLVNRAVIGGSVVLPFKAIVIDSAVDSLSKSKVSRQIVLVRKKEKRIWFALVGKKGPHEVQGPQLFQFQWELQDP